MIVLPNLGAEEGLEPSALPPALDDAVRVFAWLFGKDVRILDWEGEIAWPEALGPAPGGPLLSELEGDAFAWLATAEAQERLRAAGGHPRLPPPSVVRAVHDKAFAQRAAPQSGRLPDCLRGLIEVLEPDEIDPAVVEAKVRSLPPWVGRDWMLKPRWGSSGRGRVRRLQDVRGSTDRLRRLGGAVFEPWLRRVEDLSALLLLLPDGGVRWIGTTRQILRAAGVYLGSRGLVDAEGRIVSGSPWDDEMRAAAEEVARRAAALGYFGPIGVDGFVFLGPDGEEVLRPVVETNARFTMGIAAVGLLMHALRQGVVTAPAEWVFSLDGQARGATRTLPLGDRALLGWRRC